MIEREYQITVYDQYRNLRYQIWIEENELCLESDGEKDYLPLPTAKELGQAILELVEKPKVVDPKVGRRPKEVRKRTPKRYPLLHPKLTIESQLRRCFPSVPNTC